MENATQQASGNSPGDLAHTSSYIYDQYWRLTSALAPPDTANNGQSDTTSFTYSLSPLMVTRQKSVTTALNDYASAYFDGVGRTFKSTHALPNGTATVNTTFDAAGQTSSVTNPYFTTSDPTYGVTQTKYDGLGRVTQVIKQDGSISQVKYNVSNSLGLAADCTITIDEAGKQHGACTDALGRLVEVDEPYASGLLINNYATLQSGGNFALFNSANSSLWSTGSSGSNAQSIFMQDDGNLVLYIFKWSAGTYAAPTPGSYPQAACSIGTYLVAGQTLPSGSCIASPHWQYFLYMAPDGNLYIYNWATGAGTWGPGTSGHPGAYARLETSGNFVVYDVNGAALWSSGTSGTNAERLDMEDDGRIILYKSAWNSGTSTGQFNWSQLAHPGCDAGIGTGTTGMLGAGQCFVSPNGHFELLLQSDGNLVIYDLGASPANALWSTNTGISPVDPGYSMRTLYSYDALGNLLRVEQHGDTSDSTQWRIRTFTYNSLSQLLTATNPESGAISYAYDTDGNLLYKTSPAPNSAQGLGVTETISYCYDELHRVLARGYSQSPNAPQQCLSTAPWLPNPAVVYAYDSGANAKGKLTSMTDQAGTATYGYDVLGRMATETRPIAGVTKSIGYSYNLNSSLKTLTYPSGRVVTYTPDTAGQLVSAVDSNGTTYVSSATYNPDGSVKSLLHGSTPALNSGFQYNPRLQLCRITALTSGTLPTSCTDSQNIGNIMDRGYDFHAGTGTSGSGTDNGNVMAITNYRDTNRSQAFTYDALNRLTSAWSSANAGNYSWGENYAVDAWGNLQIAPMSGKAHGGNFAHSATVQNQPAGLGYDAAGNLTNYNAPGQYVYDPENRMLSTAGMSYTYDGNGERVLKSQTVGGAPVKRYWSMGGNTLGEDDGSGNLTAEYIYFGGKRVARIDMPAGSVHSYLSDHLNSTSMVVSAAGVVEEESDYYPFGTEVIVTGPGANELKFTGKRRDSESQLDYFGARHYNMAFGRFLTPDPLLSSGHPADPQSWNRYTYVRNNPLANVDPTGLYDLKNTCSQSDKKCNKDFDKHAKNLKNGLKNLNDRLKNEKDPVKKARLEAALSSKTGIGTEGDHNGVTVTFGTTNGGGSGETLPVYNAQTNGFDYNVTLDPNKLNDENDYAIAGAHEGTHIDDTRNPKYANAATTLSDFSLEYRAYQTSAWAASALGRPNLTYGNGKYTIWNSGWAAVDDKVLTQFITHEYKYSNGKTYQETNPHNPWPN